MKRISLLLVCISCIGFLKAQNVGIGISSPMSTLDVARGSAGSGTALFRGTDYASHFNFGASEDTYIRGGKPFSHVIINDLFSLGNVGIGTTTPLYKLHVAAAGAGFAQSDGIYSVGTYTGVGGGWIGTYSNHPLYFFTNNGGQQMTILTNGNVGIGTTSPETKLHISKNDEALRVSGVNSYLSFYNNSNVANSYIQNSAGNLVIGTFGNDGEVSVRSNGALGLVVQNDARVRVGVLPTVQPIGGSLPKFSVHGTIGLRTTFGDQIAEWAIFPGSDLDFFYNGGLKAYINDADGEWIPLSDYRLKENFQEYTSVLDGIKKLEVLTYQYKADKTGKRSFGLVAQNVQEYFPEIVSENSGPENYLGIAYAKTGVLAIKGIQEQQLIIEAQQSKIDELEQRLAGLESKLK